MKVSTWKLPVWRALIPVGVAALFFASGAVVWAQAPVDGKAPATPPPVQRGFDSPQTAFGALVLAAENFHVPALLEVLGPDGKDLVDSGDTVQDRKRAQDFANQARQKQKITLDPKNPARATAVIGELDWPFPIPMVKRKGKWYFDSRAGRQEILLRRIGANELDAIQICHGYVEAQHEYSEQMHDDSGVHQYAQKIISTPGKRDGLSWVNPDGTQGGPISETVARALEEGYTPGKGTGFHGYYFKVLKGQGPAATLGELDYVINGIMIGGFALVAAPVEYGVTGIMSFMVGHDGIVYQKDLGPNTLQVFEKMERYNPDRTWRWTQDQWPD